MSNPRLAIRYAKSLIDLAKEKDQLSEVYNDIRFLQRVCKSSPDFISLLKSPIIPQDKKNRIIESIITNKVSKITSLFIKLLGTKNRESNLPGIIDSYIEQYNELKGIHKVKLTTATPLSSEMQNTFINKIEAANNISNIELETIVDEQLVGGFVLEMEGKLVDASILRDLKDVKKQFQNNDYIQRLR
jgi:F-type H+-transporting ATPase subunit delta